MLFNSVQFAVFFAVVFALYLCFSHRWQNRMLLVASCVFYGAWDVRFLLLMFVSITTDYFCSLKMFSARDERTRKTFFLLAILVNLSILGFFKYFNFFSANLESLFSLFGFHPDPITLKIILPVGISFYTFQAMSYAFDVYRRELGPCRSYLDYALFVTYFPHLVAGPIMKARNLLPQVMTPRKVTLDGVYEGAYWILWGYFQKVFVADNLSLIVDGVFNSSGPHNGAGVLLAVYAFAFQIYCDFAGYSNIAKGLGKCMGFDIITNFNLPYFSTNPAEFWTRWHISLSTWLKEYLYFPLGGNRQGRGKTYRNLALTMVIGGLWHGAAWTFVLWGVYQGSLLVLHRMMLPLLNKVRGVGRGLRIFLFFHAVCFGWLLFRAGSVHQVGEMLRDLFTNFHPAGDHDVAHMTFRFLLLTWFLIVVEFVQYKKNDLKFILQAPLAARVCFFYLVMFFLVFFGADGGKQFIYFQF